MHPGCEQGKVVGPQEVLRGVVVAITVRGFTGRETGSKAMGEATMGGGEGVSVMNPQRGALLDYFLGNWFVTTTVMQYRREVRVNNIRTWIGGNLS